MAKKRLTPEQRKKLALRTRQNIEATGSREEWLTKTREELKEKWIFKEAAKRFQAGKIITKDTTEPSPVTRDVEGKLSTWFSPLKEDKELDVTEEDKITVEPTEDIIDEDIIEEKPTKEKTLKERVAERIAWRKTFEERLREAREEEGRPELLEQRRQFREEARAVQEDLENIRKWLEAEWGAITKIAASRIREARSAPLRDQLVSLVKWIEITSGNIKELDQSIEGIMQARELDRQQEVATLTSQIEGSDLTTEVKNALITQLGQQTARMKREDELEMFRQKEQIKADVEQKDQESLAKTWLTAEQNLQAATIIEDFDVKEDSIAWQSIRKLLKEWKTPAQVRQILWLSEDATGKIDDEQFTRQEKLRKEFEWSATVKNYIEAVQQYGWVVTSLWSKTWPWDMAAIFAFMKTLDPSSVVRESEFNAAAASLGLWEQAKNFFSWEKLLKWAFLTEKWRATFAKIAKQLFDNRKEAFDERATKFIRLAKEAWANPRSVVLDFDSIPWVASDIKDEELAPISWDSTDEELINYIRKSWKWNTLNTDSSDEDIGSFLDTDNEGLDKPDQTGTPKVSTKIGGILWPLQNKVTVVKKWWDNPVLWLQWWSLTFRTNNPLAITATQPGTAERLTKKFNAIPNLFSPDSADNLVLNFRTPEEWLRAWRQLLDSKWDLSIFALMESHTWWSALSHKAAARKLGLSLNTKFKDLSEEDKNKVIEAIKVWEGHREWNIIS